MNKLLVLKRELKQVGWVSLYFFFCFSVILTLKKLLLAGYQVEVDTVSTAIISALILAKIVLILDATEVGKRFDARLPLGTAALYKTMTYLLVTFLVLFLEKLFHAYREFDELSQALKAIWLNKDLNLIQVKLIAVGLTLFSYFLYTGVDHQLGKGRLRRMIMEHPADLPASSNRFTE